LIFKNSRFVLRKALAGKSFQGPSTDVRTKANVECQVPELPF